MNHTLTGRRLAARKRRNRRDRPTAEAIVAQRSSLRRHCRVRAFARPLVELTVTNWTTAKPNTRE